MTDENRALVFHHVEEVWRKGRDCSNGRADATTHDGHLHGNQTVQAHARGLNEDIVFILVLEKKQTG